LGTVLLQSAYHDYEPRKNIVEAGIARLISIAQKARTLNDWPPTSSDLLNHMACTNVVDSLRVSGFDGRFAIVDI
jgi:hypothetical protein